MISLLENIIFPVCFFFSSLSFSLLMNSIHCEESIVVCQAGLQAIIKKVSDPSILPGVGTYYCNVVLTNIVLASAYS